MLALIVTPILEIIACITLVGLGVGIAAILLYRMALGLLILRILRLLAHVGPLIILLAIVWGLGGLVLALYQRMLLQPVAA